MQLALGKHQLAPAAQGQLADFASSEREKTFSFQSPNRPRELGHPIQMTAQDFLPVFPTRKGYGLVQRNARYLQLQVKFRIFQFSHPACGHQFSPQPLEFESFKVNAAGCVFDSAGQVFKNVIVILQFRARQLPNHLGSRERSPHQTLKAHLAS